MPTFHSSFPAAVCTLGCLLFVAGDADARAQPTAPAQAPRQVEAVRLAPEETITLDGRLDEPVWERTIPAADFVQIDPDNGAPATEPTEVHIAYDADALYLGVICYDSEPDKWLGFQRRRDEFLSADDRFQWTIDTFLDGRTGYFFETNPSGLMADSLMGINGDNREWDGIWNERVRHTEAGWVVEIRIPFRTLNFDPDHDTWGINFQRTVRRKNEDSIWMGWARNQGLRRMTNAGRVSGIRNVTQGRGLDIKPYGLASAEAAGPGQAMHGHGQSGVDLFYNPTPLLRANLTVNTDFAQTEVDQRQVNLTRFSLFFPEKRDFFLDGATFFDFASTAGPEDLLVNPFFSRRVGLTADGTPQGIDYGTKLTGQLGAESIGVLQVQTRGDEETGLPGEEFTVARVKHRMFRQSYLGAIYTRRDARVPGAEARHTAGVDLRLATSSFLGSQNLELLAWGQHATGPDARRGNNAFGASLAYPNDRWNGRLDVREVQANFDPAVGFVTRRDYRRYVPTLTFGPRPQHSDFVRRYTFTGTIDIQTTLDNRLLNRDVTLVPFEVELQSQDTFGVQVLPGYERLDEPFVLRIAPGRRVTLPMGGAYTTTRYQVNAQTANRRVVAFDGRFETGGFYSGTRRELVMNWTVRARPGLIVYLTGELNRIELPEASFDTRLYRVVAETQFTPFMALVNNVQYDSVSAGVGWQSRFRWIVTPGDDIYVVYGQNWQDDPLRARFVSQDRRLSTKLLYTYRF
jgi:hypothetical protein